MDAQKHRALSTRLELELRSFGSFPRVLAPPVTAFLVHIL